MYSTFCHTHTHTHMQTYTRNWFTFFFPYRLLWGMLKVVVNSISYKVYVFLLRLVIRHHFKQDIVSKV